LKHIIQLNYTITNRITIYIYINGYDCDLFLLLLLLLLYTHRYCILENRSIEANNFRLDIYHNSYMKNVSRFEICLSGDTNILRRFIP